MNEGGLRELLREVPLPDREDAERRGLSVVRAAFAQRQPRRPAHTRPARLAIAFAIAALLTALLLSPAGAAVRDWIGDTFDAGMPNAEHGLAEVPGGGRLLVESTVGPWVVQPDGSRRLLGHYREATWSPRGLFVAVATGRTLSAVEPDGDPHWSLDAAARVTDPRWAPLGERIAYRSGNALRVTVADGSGDRPIAAPTRALAPAWSPLGAFQLAYVSAGGELRIADTESGATVGSARALTGVRQLEWGGHGVLLEASRRALWTRPTETSKLAGTVRIGTPRWLPMPEGGGTIRDVALSPSGRTVAALVGLHGHRGPRSVVLLYPARGGRPQRLLGVPGHLGQLAWSPDGKRLLVTWPGADQWLFLPVGRGEGRALAGIAAAFAPGHGDAAFPQVEGWCCRAR
ncbi:MAG TPA: hypothetical protein VLL27_03695 [Solirubrobacterales bacterium]|nr:hypothetical protein [Solirubrobacterales bacterium]